ncbi:hypothetical protein GV794_00535 [Nocardia cyriacigeorgica]|uniref:Uncharacterized protein n=1 Tax=Nocardia cyriacigeorgica TaxID=135487 RepID=A0A6P1D0M3_9NOCA|nr:hypothetical protein [Nocardia cyriacigeorgica]NEW38408.1 hypothetical protein [Nocardia cyriacigeorgica]NEW43628.1 hypothetical protein [Nocardia cyriacigeorgica]NEW49436.1 hypothetical protein [Nocardia cyriacigeorgica]NEW54160.1 hypothetical protein [Nocardia cyriacigeorgica]
MRGTRGERIDLGAPTGSWSPERPRPGIRGSAVDDDGDPGGYTYRSADHSYRPRADVSSRVRRS